MRIWIDFTNTPHVNVLVPLIHELEREHRIICSAREFSETIPYLKMKGIEPLTIGRYEGKSRIKKAVGLAGRFIQLAAAIPPFDLSLSLGGNYTATLSWLRRKPSIVFSDNDISFKAPAYKFGTYFIFPSYFNTNHLRSKHGIMIDQVFQYDGFKEDIYIAAYEPDPDFPIRLPFRDFITIRPENLKASYVPKNSKTIVPDLFRTFRDKNILYLPRYYEERRFAKGYRNIFIPDSPLNGLDVCYYSKAILTGAGTFAREAALLGTPAVSFFPGKYYLSVDVIMNRKGWEFQSRNVDQIKRYVSSAQKRPFQPEKSQRVLEDVLSIIENIIKKVRT